MDTETRNYLQMHLTSIARNAEAGDLLSRRIISLFTTYRLGTATHEAITLLKKSVKTYSERVEKEIGVRP